MTPARLDLAIIQGATLRTVLRIMQPRMVYRPITAIAPSAPVRLTVDHGLPGGWPVWVRGVRGLQALNAEPPTQRPHRAEVIDASTLEINRISATGQVATGGELVYQKAPATAKKVSVEGKVVDVAMPDYAAYALTDTGKVYAWGTGGGLGRLLPVLTWPDSRVVAKPTLWKKLPAAKAIFAGGDSAIAELKDGRVVLWGEPGDWDGHDHRKYASSPSARVRSCSVGLLRGTSSRRTSPRAGRIRASSC